MANEGVERKGAQAGPDLPGVSAPTLAPLRPTRYRTFLEARSLPTEVLRYAAAGVMVAAACTGLVLAVAREHSDEAASAVDDAVMIDLPPADASSLPASDAAQGPEQQAMQATPAQEAPPQQVAPPKPVEDPPIQPAPQPPVETPPVPVLPNPAAALDRKQAEAAPPPEPVAAPPTPAQEERAPAGSEAPTVTKEEDSSDEGRPHASRHAITLWQRSLMRRLESAKRLVSHASHAAGTAAVAFRIDAHGALASERVATSSGSAALDRAALELIRMAAPFPPPPSGSGDNERFFVVPVRFR